MKQRRRRKSVLGCLALVMGLGCAAGDVLAAEDNELLGLDIIELMNLTVTSVSKKEQPVANTPAAVFVITQEDIHRSGVTTIADALAMAPGLQVAKSSASTWSVNSRGFGGYTSNKLLVLLDGRSLYSPAYSGTFWDAQNTLLEDVERIEVIRGPGATMWGANAVNGVINIITKKAKDTQGGLVRFGAGNQEKIMAAGRYGGKLNDSTYGRMYLSYNDHGSNVLDGSDADAHDDWRPAQGGFRVDGSPNSLREWTLQGDLYRNDENQLTFPSFIDQPPYVAAKSGTADVDGGNLLGRWHEELAPGRALTLQAYYDQSSREQDYMRLQFETIDVDLQYETPMGQRQKWIMGAGYRYIDTSNEPTPYLLFPDRTDDLYNVFLQDEIGVVADTLWLTLGVKYEHNDYSGSEWQPSAKLLYKPLENHSVWASAARAVRTPSLVDHEGRTVLGGIPTPLGLMPIVLNGNPDFDSEILWAYETGYRWQASKKLSFDASLFYHDYSKLNSLSAGTLTTSGYSLMFTNDLEGHGQGVELAANWKPLSWLSLALTYSYLELDMTLTDPAGNAALGEYIANSSPKNQASLRSSFALAENWQLNLWLRYVDEIACINLSSPTQEAIAIDQYLLFDANIIWTPVKNLEVMLAGQNLFDEARLQYVPELLVPPTEIERGVYGKITYRF